MPAFFTAMIICLIVPSKTEWISSLPSTLPHADNHMAIAYYNQTVFLVGGWRHTKSVIKYDIEKDTLISYNDNALSANTWGCSSYSQIDDILYMIDSDSGANINMYNLLTNQFTVNALTNDIPMNVGDEACLTSINNDLYAIGGWTEKDGTLDTVQIFTISSDSWRLAPSMLQGRWSSTCKASSATNKLYVIGGSSLATVEFISVIDIDANTWEYTSNDLSQGLRYIASVVYEPFIYAISGYNDVNYLPIVHIIDTRTNEVSLSLDEMVYGGANMSPYIIGSRLYAFGGWDGSDIHDEWQYFDLPAMETTTLYPTTTEPTTTGSTTTTEPMTSTLTNPTALLSTLLINIIVIVCIVCVVSIVCVLSMIYTKRIAQNDNNAMVDAVYVPVDDDANADKLYQDDGREMNRVEMRDGDLKRTIEGDIADLQNNEANNEDDTQGYQYKGDADKMEINVTIGAMKNDKIALGIISTRRDKSDTENEENKTNDGNEREMTKTTLNAMKQDKIALGIISTKK